jgi:Patatin-like phospholipase
MRNFLRNIFYSLPVQLFVLHFRKYQILLLFWYLLFSTLASGFMKSFGADALFFTPEYLGKINFTSALIVGVALGIFIMCWNITTFILHTKRLKFLATTADPFLQYCINNFLLPLALILFYIIRLFYFDISKELMSTQQTVLTIVGILLGLILQFIISFVYFFGARKTIEYSLVKIVANPSRFNESFSVKNNKSDEFGLRVLYYLSKTLKIKKVRNVAHYRQDYLDAIFKRYHFAAIVAILISFVAVVVIGFFQDSIVFQIPAAASTLISFALLVAVIGALTYFLQSWSLPFVIVFMFVLNILYNKKIIDPRNKAYGLSYNNNTPAYNKQTIASLCTANKIETDKQNMLNILNKWKAKQKAEKPTIVFINVSGGGLRSAAFTMNALQKTDSICNGDLMNQAFLISGASGGMLAAAYYRALYNKKLTDTTINIFKEQYTDNISKDLLNPVFTSLMARDILSPAQKFAVGNNKYIKDRGYAFENKLAQNTDGLLNIQMKDVQQAESNATIPLIFFNNVIKSDARKMLISTQPISFMMKPLYMQNDSAGNADAVDFGALFYNQNPQNLRMLTALRMNATFPYVLPNVWLPSEPVIDVMDAGLRDNYGLETTLRFIDNFKDWIEQNTAGVLIIEIRDRKKDNWQAPFETKTIGDMFVGPATMLQHNFFKMQNYYQNDAYNYFINNNKINISKATLMYVAANEENGAALSFHLTSIEKRDVVNAYNNSDNQAQVKKIKQQLSN